MVFNCVRVHIHTYMHTRTHLSYWYWLIAWPESESADTKEWKWSRMAEGWGLYALCTDSACRQSRRHTHTHAAHPPSAGGFLATADAAATFFIGSVSAAHEHTHIQTMQTMQSFSLYILSHCHCHTRMQCVFVCLWKHVLHKLYYVCACMCHGGLLYLWRAFS